MATVEDETIRLFTVPLPDQEFPAILQELDRQNVIQSTKQGYCLVRFLTYGKMDQLAATDFANNIHFFDLPPAHQTNTNFLDRPSFTIYNAHAKLITDIQFITIASTDSEVFDDSEDSDFEPEDTAST